MVTLVGTAILVSHILAVAVELVVKAVVLIVLVVLKVELVFS
jgi:hypothetical protein